MARKRKYRYVTDPILKASVVIEQFVSKAGTDLANWARDYMNKIREYRVDENRQVLAAIKLAGYYQGLADPDVRNAIREAILRAKAKQAEVVSGALPKVPTPVVSAEARTTAKKVAEIIGVATPAV